MSKTQDIENIEQMRMKIISLFDGSGEDDAEIERNVGLPRSIIYDWRNKRNRSFRSYLPQIADYFKISLDWLVGTEQKEKPLTERERLIRDCLDIMNSLPEDLQQAAHEQLRALAAVADKNKKK